MKIGFDAKRLFNNFTGLGNHSRTTIDLLMADFPQHTYCLYTPSVRENSVTLPYLSRRGCTVVRPRGWLKGGAWRTFGLAGASAADGVELFHGLSNELPVGLKVPSVVTIHDVAFKTFTDMYHWHDRIIYDWKWRYACRRADRIIAISECTKRDVMRFYGVDADRIDVVYQPVNRVYYKPLDENSRSESDEPYMLYVGSVNSRKNLLGIVQAMELLPDDLRLPLVIVGGGGAYKQEVLRYIATRHLERYFRWETAIDCNTLKRLYANATLFVYPSFYEGFGLPVVEAQLCGCPVVTSNVSSLPEAGGPWAQQADPSSIEDIRDKMRLLLTDSELRQKTIVEGRKYAAETFNPHRLAAQLMEVYLKTIR